VLGTKRLFLVLLGALALPAALAADPGESWFTQDTAASPDQVRWLAPRNLCRIPAAKLPQAVQSLGSRSFVALTAKTLMSYTGASCKGHYGEFPYLVRAVSTAGDGRLDAGLLGGELWMQYAGMGGRFPFEKTPVVVWLDAPPTQVHVSVSIVE